MHRRLLVLISVILVALAATACGAEDTVAAPDSADESDGTDGDSAAEEATVGEAGPPAELPEVPADAVDLTGQGQVEIMVGDNNYTPQVVVVSPETEVIWTNTGRNRHNVISAADEPAFEQIDTEDLDDGGSDSRSFAQVGAYPYYCSIHGSPNRGQRGSIVVLPDP
ncbi:MAG: plastocyanin/azurin family copper-binding protein [Acidimicrobiales bacterium]